MFSGKFTFPAIVAGLAELLGDDDANIRAVAAIALAHAGKLEWVVWVTDSESHSALQSWHT